MWSLTTSASVFAAKHHAGQYRNYGHAFDLKESYIAHPARVAGSVAELFGSVFDYVPIGKDQDSRENLELETIRADNMIAAAWCHDILEDCSVSVDILVNATSHWCCKLVKQLTNPSKDHPHLSRVQRKEMDRDHIKGIEKDAKIIKAFDRIDNIRGIINAPRDFACLYLSESRKLAECLTEAGPQIHGKLVGIIELAENHFKV